MAGVGRDAETNRFRSEIDVHALYAYVRDVALAANSAEPWRVSKRAFDATRRGHARFAGGLSADGVVKRLR